MKAGGEGDRNDDGSPPSHSAFRMPNSPFVSRVTRAVVWNQAIWTAGYSLTTGGFLTYFGRELGANGLLIALLLATPETAGIFGLFSRWAVHHLGGRKRVWFWCSLSARFVSVGIPLLAFPGLRPHGLDHPVWLLIGVLAISQALGAMAYIAYLSWLSDLVPNYQWGRFFAKRNIAKLSVLLVVPIAGGYLRDWWRSLIDAGAVPAEFALWAYVAAFGIGIGLLLVSMLPLLSLPNVPVRAASCTLPSLRLLHDAWRNRSLRYLLIHNWQLAFSNGLTQAAFFFYSYQNGPLGISLGTYYVLTGLMHVVKIPVSSAAGFVCDRFGNKPPLFWGVLIASSGLLFWLAATPGQWWWLFGAYLLWGAFAAVNISGRNLLLKLAPASDNTAHLGLFRLVAGVLAGLSGILGGFWLDELRTSGFLIVLGNYRFESYQLLFAISLVGRLTSVLWILPIDEPGAKSAGWMLRALRHRRTHRRTAPTT